MATRNPRVQVALSDETCAFVAELAELSGKSRSAVISEVVDVALPAMQAMRDALRVVKEQPKEAERLLARFANAATAELAQAQLDLTAHVDARTVQGRRRKRGQAT